MIIGDFEIGTVARKNKTTKQNGILVVRLDEAVIEVIEEIYYEVPNRFRIGAYGKHQFFSTLEETMRFITEKDEYSDRVGYGTWDEDEDDLNSL